MYLYCLEYQDVWKNANKFRLSFTKTESEVEYGIEKLFYTICTL